MDGSFSNEEIRAVLDGQPEEEVRAALGEQYDEIMGGTTNVPSQPEDPFGGLAGTSTVEPEVREEVTEVHLSRSVEDEAALQEALNTDTGREDDDQFLDAVRETALTDTTTVESPINSESASSEVEVVPPVVASVSNETNQQMDDLFAGTACAQTVCAETSTASEEETESDTHTSETEEAEGTDVGEPVQVTPEEAGIDEEFLLDQPELVIGEQSTEEDTSQAEEDSPNSQSSSETAQSSDDMDDSVHAGFAAQNDKYAFFDRIFHAFDKVYHEKKLWKLLSQILRDSISDFSRDELLCILMFIYKDPTKILTSVDESEVDNVISKHNIQLLGKLMCGSRVKESSGIGSFLSDRIFASKGAILNPLTLELLTTTKYKSWNDIVPFENLSDGYAMDAYNLYVSYEQEKTSKDGLMSFRDEGTRAIFGDTRTGWFKAMKSPKLRTVHLWSEPQIIDKKRQVYMRFLISGLTKKSKDNEGKLKTEKIGLRGIILQCKDPESGKMCSCVLVSELSTISHFVPLNSRAICKAIQGGQKNKNGKTGVPLFTCAGRMMQSEQFCRKYPKLAESALRMGKGFNDEDKSKREGAEGSSSQLREESQGASQS